MKILGLHVSFNGFSHDASASLIVDEKVKAKLSREGYNPIFGARPLRRLVTKYVEDLISENLLKNPMTSKTRTIKIQLNEDDEIVVKN